MSNKSLQESETLDYVINLLKIVKGIRSIRIYMILYITILLLEIPMGQSTILNPMEGFMRIFLVLFLPFLIAISKFIEISVNL
jgi:hypothetical protein